MAFMDNLPLFFTHACMHVAIAYDNLENAAAKNNVRLNFLGIKVNVFGTGRSNLNFT